MKGSCCNCIVLASFLLLTMCRRKRMRGWCAVKPPSPSTPAAPSRKPAQQVCETCLAMLNSAPQLSVTGVGAVPVGAGRRLLDLGEDAAGRAGRSLLQLNATTNVSETTITGSTPLTMTSNDTSSCPLAQLEPAYPTMVVFTTFPPTAVDDVYYCPFQLR